MAGSSEPAAVLDVLGGSLDPVADLDFDHRDGHPELGFGEGVEQVAQGCVKGWV